MRAREPPHTERSVHAPQPAVKPFRRTELLLARRSCARRERGGSGEYCTISVGTTWSPETARPDKDRCERKRLDWLTGVSRGKAAHGTQD
jgi:hypothetical protein